ncbi:MAG: transglycosylase SLT domain-containing protein [Burkholderiaceae bacterium]
MTQATNYALRITRAAGFAWLDSLRDVRDGAMAMVRLVVTLTGCTVLLAVAAVISNEEARGQLVELLPSSVPFMATAEATPAEVQDEPSQAAPAAKAAAIDPRQKFVVQYLARRYRVADEAARMLVANAFEIGQQKNLDPLLILSVVAIESGLNPFAASPMGAQGLMQVMTRVHAERFVEHGGDLAALDPIANMKVGSEILHELIRRGGSLERGLQLYVGAGNSPDDGGYGAKVLGERSRLQIAATGKVDAAIAAARAAGAPVQPKPAETNLQADQAAPQADVSSALRRGQAS